MSNSIGKSIVLTLFGESHGPYIGVVIDGLTAGIKINEDFIKFYKETKDDVFYWVFFIQRFCGGCCDAWVPVPRAALV